MKPNGRKLIDQALNAGCPVAALPISVFPPPAVPVPDRFKGRPRDARGYLVPFFVAYPDGVPDFRCADQAKYQACMRHSLCWLCGQPHESTFTFVIGPMCALNRNTAEPPCHHECARYAVQVCPFLTKPRMRRNEKGIPEECTDPAGLMILRNPGVTLLWTTDTFRQYRTPDGPLIRVGPARQVEWWAEGRAATFEEVRSSIDSGLPILRDAAAEGGPEGVVLFEQLRVEMDALVVRSFPEGVLT